MRRPCSAGSGSPTRSGTAERGHWRCGAPSTLPWEIATGWIDIYDDVTEGQHVDITGVPDGRYALRSIANPDRFVAESRYDNNSSVAYVELSGNRVTLLPAP